MLRFIAFFIFLVSFAIPAHAAPQKLFDAQSIILKNGMQVVVIPNHRAPILTHMIWYKVGSADEPQGDGVSGEAHFLEHLMFKGTQRIPAGEFSKIIRGIGGNDNAFTSWDFTAYFQSIPKEYLSLVMALEADRMLNVSPPTNDITSEHNVIIEERKQRTDNDPKALFAEQMRAALYNTSPYGIPIIGWKNEMPKLTWEHAKAYHDRWYTPSNAILVISGDVTMNEVQPLAEKYFAYIPSRPVPDHIRADVPVFQAPSTLKFQDKSVQQPVYMRANLGPSLVTNYTDSLALQIVENILSSSSASRLYQDLVVKEKVASSVELYVDGDVRGQGNIWLTALPSKDVPLETLQEKIATAFRTYITTNPLTDEDVKAAQQRLVDQAIFARDSVTGPAMVIGQGLAMGLTLDQIENWPRDIAAITPKTVREALKKYLDPDSPQHPFIHGKMLPAELKKP
jgi:zinc protease